MVAAAGQSWTVTLRRREGGGDIDKEKKRAKWRFPGFYEPSIYDE
jgi:hypothetical protein